MKIWLLLLLLTGCDAAIKIKVETVTTNVCESFCKDNYGLAFYSVNVKERTGECVCINGTRKTLMEMDFQ